MCLHTQGFSSSFFEFLRSRNRTIMSNVRRPTGRLCIANDAGVSFENCRARSLAFLRSRNRTIIRNARRPTGRLRIANDAGVSFETGLEACFLVAPARSSRKPGCLPPAPKEIRPCLRTGGQASFVSCWISVPYSFFFFFSAAEAPRRVTRIRPRIPSRIFFCWAPILGSLPAPSTPGVWASPSPPRTAPRTELS